MGRIYDLPKLRMPPRRIDSGWPIGAYPAGGRLRRETAAQVNGMGMQRRMRYPGDGDFEVRPGDVPVASDFSTSTTNHEEGARKTMSEILVFADKSIFWDYDDPEMSIEDPDEAINDGPGCGAVMHFQVAVSQPDMWGAKRYVASKDEYETAYFDNETEAENWRTGLPR